MICLQLLLSFLQIGALSFGGGYAALPLIQEQVVDLHHWLTLTEFNDLVTISQMTPGPIAINAATFVGLKMGGAAGAVTATAGCVLPSCILVSLLAWAYFRYREMEKLKEVLRTLRPAVVAMIAAAGLLLIRTTLFGESGPITVESFRWLEAGLFVLALVMLRWKKWDPILVMALCGGLEVAAGLCFPGLAG